MKNESKTDRIFDIIKWLNKEGETGISKDNIIHTYGITEKTFKRDVDFLKTIFPEFISYDKVYKRLKGYISLKKII